MKILFDVFFIVLLFFLFGLPHSLLASNFVKEKFVNWLGTKIAFFRLAYNFISVISFYLIYEFSPKPDIVIYDLNFPFDIVIFVLQIFSLVGLVWAARSIDWKEFAGVSQVIRWKNKTYSVADLDESSVLKTDGPFSLCRHPVYLFSILFLGLRPTMSLFYLVFYICIVAYFYVGSVYEEKKLLLKFGEAYKNYQSVVPRMIPRKIYNKNF